MNAFPYASGIGQKIVVGTPHYGYPEKRLFYSLPFTRARMVRAVSLCSLLNAVWFRLAGRIHAWLHNMHVATLWPRVDVLHLFNGIARGRTPWFSSFETALPRFKSARAGWARLLASPRCKGIFALSEAAATIQKESLDHVPDVQDTILQKLDVLHPAQAPLISSFEERRRDPAPLHFVLVGGAFVRKGGSEVLSCFEDLWRSGQDVHLTIVSSLSPSHYGMYERPGELREIRSRLTAPAEKLTWHRYLPNEDVLALLRRADVALLPSYAETYGYFVLEAQAAGCPVITTNVRALPEINNEDCGWILAQPCTRNYGWDLTSTEKRESARRVLRQDLARVLREILAHPDIADHKGRKALERIRRQHDPRRIAEYLEERYARALA
jgi:glycosyltransferase involved in cell wall biosynthesis